MNTLAVLGIGNILEGDDGMAVYACTYLEANYAFSPKIHIINGGVEGINLLNVFMEFKPILILDVIDIKDAPGSIYHIPSDALTGYGINSGGAHEVGVMQCIDMCELLGHPLPRSSVLGIVPERVTVQIGLSEVLQHAFERYVDTILAVLKTDGVTASPKKPGLSLKEIIHRFKDGTPP